MPAYSEILLDHFHHPRNHGELAGANAVGDSSNDSCGDLMRLFLRIEGDTIKEATFMTLGCAAAIATGSILTEMIVGRPVAAALAITNEQVATALGGMPPGKVHCSVLAEQALRSAVNAFERRAKVGRNLKKRP